MAQPSRKRWLQSRKPLIQVHSAIRRRRWSQQRPESQVHRPKKHSDIGVAHHQRHVRWYRGLWRRLTLIEGRFEETERNAAWLQAIKYLPLSEPVAYRQSPASGKVLRILVLQLRQQGQPKPRRIQIPSWDGFGTVTGSWFPWLFAILQNTS